MLIIISCLLFEVYGFSFKTFYIWKNAQRYKKNQFDLELNFFLVKIKITTLYYKIMGGFYMKNIGYVILKNKHH